MPETRTEPFFCPLCLSSYVGVEFETPATATVVHEYEGERQVAVQGRVCRKCLLDLKVSIG